MSGLFILSTIVVVLKSEVSPQFGVVLYSLTPIHSAPFESATVLFELNEGAEVSILNKSSEWFEVQFDSQKKGWVAATQLFQVSL